MYDKINGQYGNLNRYEDYLTYLNYLSDTTISDKLKAQNTNGDDILP